MGFLLFKISLTLEVLSDGQYVFKLTISLRTNKCTLTGAVFNDAIFPLLFVRKKIHRTLFFTTRLDTKKWYAIVTTESCPLNAAALLLEGNNLLYDTNLMAATLFFKEYSHVFFETLYCPFRAFCWLSCTWSSKSKVSLCRFVDTLWFLKANSS